MARKGLPKALLDRLESTGVLQPVYEAMGARLVAYPEIRVYADDTPRETIMRAIDGSGIAADVEASEGGDMTVRPKSGRASDAVTLANVIVEHARPASAQVRFARIVPHPGAIPARRSRG